MNKLNVENEEAEDAITQVHGHHGLKECASPSVQSVDEKRILLPFSGPIRGEKLDTNSTASSPFTLSNHMTLFTQPRILLCADFG